jgi:hypothetical protein
MERFAMSKANLCFFKYSVKFTEEYEHYEFKTELRTGVVCAKSFRDAMYKITDYYGDENIEDVRIEFMEDLDILEIDDIMGYFEKNEENSDE